MNGPAHPSSVKRKEGNNREGWGNNIWTWPPPPRNAYTWCRTNKGPLRSWLHFTGKSEDPWYPTCGEKVEETGTHIVFECPRYAEHRMKAGNPREWREVDHPIWVTEEGAERYDGVLDLFWAIGRQLRIAR